MDTYILMPAEFELADQPGQGLETARTLYPQPGQGLKTTRTLYPGMTFHPDQGIVKQRSLDVYEELTHTDVRRNFGCYDQIKRDSNNGVLRNCNWVRFLRTTSDVTAVNMVAVVVHNLPLFQVVKHVTPGSELVVFFSANLNGRSWIDVIQDFMAFNSGGSNWEVEADIRPTDIQTAGNNQPRGGHIISQQIPGYKTYGSPSRDPRMNISHRDLYVDHRPDVEDHRSPSPVQQRRLPFVPDSPQTTDSGVMSGRSDGCPSDESSPSATSPVTHGDEKLIQECVGTPLTVSPLKRSRERRWLPCEVCGKSFDRPSLLRRHMRTHTGEKPHACEVCAKAFSTSSSLNTHRRIHSGEKPHQCRVCGKRFTASSNLYYHRMTHNKEKPHKCTLCSRSFPTPGDLKNHMYVHNGSWPFRCPICDRGFSKQTNMRNHVLLHTGDKPHKCNLCGKKFALQCNLKSHLKTHEGDPVDQCQQCEQVYLSYSRSVINGRCRHCLESVLRTANISRQQQQMALHQWNMRKESVLSAPPMGYSSHITAFRQMSDSSNSNVYPLVLHGASPTIVSAISPDFRYSTSHQFSTKPGSFIMRQSFTEDALYSERCESPIIEVTN